MVVTGGDARDDAVGLGRGGAVVTERPADREVGDAFVGDQLRVIVECHRGPSVVGDADGNADIDGAQGGFGRAGDVLAGLAGLLEGPRGGDLQDGGAADVGQGDRKCAGPAVEVWIDDPSFRNLGDEIRVGAAVADVHFDDEVVIFGDVTRAHRPAHFDLGPRESSGAGIVFDPEELGFHRILFPAALDAGAEQAEP